MLDRHHDSLTLNCLDIAGPEARPKIRVLAGDVLEIPTPKRRAVYVEPRTKHHVRPLALELLRDGLGHHRDQRLVPRRRQCEHGGPTRRSAELARPCVGAEAGAGVLHLQVGYAQARDAMHFPHPTTVHAETVAIEHAHALLVGHLFHCLRSFLLRLGPGEKGVAVISIFLLLLLLLRRLPFPSAAFNVARWCALHLHAQAPCIHRRFATRADSAVAS
mmetsp:Transcript_69821/g.177178  ORF Transcript_69821/g.177178 Transcript_69821/m.177178 type:complete len:218 (+) Transcript_69821:1738-2391(+)